MSSDTAHVESPCIGVCRLNANDFCVGCRRSRDEIAAWPTLSSVQQRKLLEVLENRQQE